VGTDMGSTPSVWASSGFLDLCRSRNSSLDIVAELGRIDRIAGAMATLRQVCVVRLTPATPGSSALAAGTRRVYAVRVDIDASAEWRPDPNDS